VQELGLFLVRHGRLDRLLAARDHDAVVLLHQVVEGCVFEQLPGEPRHERGRDVQRLEGHRLAVGKAQAPDQHHARIGGDVERTPDRGACMYLAQLDRPAAGHHAAPAHVFAERREGELLGDLRFADEGPAPVPPLEIAVPNQVVEGGPQREPRDADLRAEPALGGNGLADVELLDQLEHALPGQDLFAHGLSMEAQHPVHGQDHLGRKVRKFTLLTH
jgi:hypothetical protein